VRVYDHMRPQASANCDRPFLLHFGATYTAGDSDVISMPAGFRRHLVGKTLTNVFHCHITEIGFVGKLVITDIFINQRIECCFNDTINLRRLTPHIMPCYTYTRSSAIAEGPRDASYQLKSCQLPRNSAETTYTTSPDQIDGMKLEI